MTDTPPLDLKELADSLRKLGYDIAPETPERGRPPWSAIVARRDLGERVVLAVIDQAGRLRVELTWLVGEWPAEVTLAGVGLRSVDRVSRGVTLTGQVASIERAAAVVESLGAIESWAAPADGLTSVSGDNPPPP